VVERTFSWLIKKRHLVVDYEKLPETSEFFIALRICVRTLITYYSLLITYIPTSTHNSLMSCLQTPS